MTASTPTATAGPVLRDIHLPSPPGWWPPAPGWWIVAVIVLGLLTWLAVYLYKKHERSRHRRAIMRELDRCIEQAQRNPVALAAALSAFLRRIERRDTPAAVALPGERWLEYLDKRSASDEFTRGVGRVLIEAPYRAAMSYDTAGLIALVRRCTRRALETGVSRA